MKSNESKQVTITYEEINIIKEKIKNIKIILVSENIKIDNMEQEVWELFLANKILKEEKDESMNQNAKLFLKTIIERSPEDILYMLRNETIYTIEDAKNAQKDQKIEWLFDKPVKEEKLMNAWSNFVNLDMPVVIRKRII